MRRLRHNLYLALAVVGLSSWGFPAHKWVNATAIHGLPPELHGWFKRHHAWLTEHAVDADRRKHTMEGESERHYIDLDRYHADADTLAAWFPMTWGAACERWGEETVQSNGIAPWNAQWAYRRLQEAFVARDEERILRAAADLGHYVGDLHVPLHTTENYDGQLTSQKGIHGLWEGQLPEQFRSTYLLAPKTARYLPDVASAVWDVVFASHAAVDSVLRFEREVTERVGEAAKFGYVERGRVLDRRYAPAFCEAYHDALEGMVERRLRASIQLTADLWYSAWLEAGAPELPAPSEAERWWKRLLNWTTG